MIEIGHVLGGRYKIQALIGSGGMANVYKAVSLNNRQLVAVKVLKEEFEGDAEFVRRFKREAEAVLALSHENIVRSLDVGEEDGAHYIVFEYIDGETLKNLIRREERLDARRAIIIACQILEGIMHAHEHGIIHRDIKPQNILINYRGKPKITDFGIARDAQASTVTFAGNSVLGSVHYISPEQAQGDLVSVQSDIYSLGVTLYEMVTGTVPFSGESSVSIALKHLQEEVPPPTDLVPNLPRSLNDIILKATSKDPAERYASAKAMKSDLLRALREPDGRFVVHARQQAQPDIPLPRAVPRRRSGVLTIGLGVLLATGLFLIMFFMSRAILSEQNVAQGARLQNFVGKNIETVQEICQSSGYKLNLSYEKDSAQPPGTVLRQTPEAGESAAAGMVIDLVVSEGYATTEMPVLIGMTLAEARLMLDGMGLTLEEVRHGISDMEEGLVFRQEPEAGQTIIEGDPVIIYVSGEEGNFVGKYIDMQLDDALAMLKQQGYERVLVRSVPVEGSDADIVVDQRPVPGDLIDTKEQIELTVRSDPSGTFKEVAYNVDIEKSESAVMITMLLDEGVEKVLYETTLPQGKQQPIPLTISSGEQREGAPSWRYVIIYVDGEEVRRERVDFAAAG